MIEVRRDTERSSEVAQPLSQRLARDGDLEVKVSSRI